MNKQYNSEYVHGWDWKSLSQFKQLLTYTW